MDLSLTPNNSPVAGDMVVLEFSFEPGFLLDDLTPNRFPAEEDIATASKRTYNFINWNKGHHDFTRNISS